MSMQQRNTVVSLVCFVLILGFFGLRVWQMVQSATFIAPNVFQLWGIVVVAGIIVTILGSILATILSSILHAVRTGETPSDGAYIEDERDKLIALKGTQVSHLVFSLGALAAMLTFVLDRPPLVMFTLLIATSLVAEIVGDVYRLLRYGKGA